MAMNAFAQYSFALDSDRIEFTFTAGATMLGADENFLFNTANAFEIGFGYDLIIVCDNMIDFTMIPQTNVLLDDDQVWGASEVNVSGADSRLVNHASVEQYGADRYMDLTPNFEAQLADLALGNEHLWNDVFEDDLSLGVDGLRALYITGVLVQVTAVSQTNVVGDQDQVALALKEFEGDPGSVNVMTRSNAPVNDSTITDLGFGSVVMAGGDVYDDALLFQAELVDANAGPNGVDLNGLATEAVAFMADDMLTPVVTENDLLGGPLPSMADEVDVMQTMTA